MLELELRLPAGGPRRVPVRVGAGALRHLVRDLARRGPGLVAVVSDSKVAALHGEALCRALRKAGLAAALLKFPAGEAHKTRDTKARIEDRLLRLGADRGSVLVALGGGVTGDLAGFVAATWHRGMPLVQAPSSLLAMVDAAIGGKASVDLPGGKNLIGAFHQPLAVYADLALLETLPARELPGGFAEVVKAAVVADARLFARLETERPALAAREIRALEAIVGASIRIKARIVASDERDDGRRQALNFGHTLAHALESASSYSIPHGRAVAIGMVLESRIATRATAFPERDARRLADLLAAFGLRTSWPQGVDPRRVREAMRRDKKNRSGSVRMALPLRIGRMPPGPEVTVGVDETLLAATLDACARGERVS